MKKSITLRLKDLQQEYQKGQEQLQKLEQETNNIRSSMLRISGAIQVLEELLGEDNELKSQLNNSKEIKGTKQ